MRQLELLRADITAGKRAGLDLIRTSSEVEWEYPKKNKFAEEFIQELMDSNILPQYSSSTLCDHCSSINLVKRISLSKARETAASCDLCWLVSESAEIEQVDDKMSLLRNSSLRICSAPGTKEADARYQIGFPTPPASESPISFSLLRKWLRVCDEEHQAFGCHLESQGKLPTRVIDVSPDEQDPGLLRLHTTDPSEEGQYIALSHCWGKLDEEQKRKFCTSKDNLSERQNPGLRLEILPQTFRDAIQVTREVGIRYLWIDSLCIIQYGDDSDWKREAALMENVFRNAYCTIAATFALDSNEGFLRRTPIETPYVYVPSSAQGPVYICNSIDNFDQDVEKGPLNQRAWVLQERALSRRTIHFSAKQIYWECGDGIHCATLSSMRKSKPFILSDPRFPRAIVFVQRQDKIRLFQELFTLYSRLGITFNTDRPIAILGLTKALEKFLGTSVRYGVFEKFLHRSLLWRRSGPTTQRIQYKEENRVPSWSWMAYEGPMEYLDIEFDSVEWNEGIRMVGSELQAPVRSIQYDGTTESGDEVWLQFDPSGVEVHTVYFVIIGREDTVDWTGRESKYYSMLVMPIAGSDSENMGCFERVGIGSCSQSVISLSEMHLEIGHIV